HLQATGVRTVRLNAYLNAIPFYERLEFRREYEVIRWHGPASAAEKVRAIRPIREDDLAGLARMDAKYFGANRQALLARLASEFATHSWWPNADAGRRDYSPEIPPGTPVKSARG